MFDLLKVTDEDVVAHADNLLEKLEHVGDLICKEKDSNSVIERRELSKTIHEEYKELKEQFRAEYEVCKRCVIESLSKTKKNYVWGIKEATTKGFQSKVNAKHITYESVYDAMDYLKYHMKYCVTE